MIDIGSQIDDVYCLYLNNILDNESIHSESEYEEILENHKNESYLYVFERKKYPIEIVCKISLVEKVWNLS